MPSYTLRHISSTGAHTILPDCDDTQINISFSDVGGISFKYALAGASAALVKDQAEIAVFQDATEIADTRAILESSNGQRFASEAETTREYKGRNLWKMLDESLCYVASWPTAAGTGDITFTAASPGTILKTLIDRAQALGELTGLTYNFTTTTASNGAAWANALNISYRMGVTILSVVQNMVDQGVIEVRMVGRQMQVYNADTLGTDRSGGQAPVVLWGARNTLEAPEATDSSGLRTAVLIEGEDGVFQETKDTNSIGAYGRRTMFLSQGGVNDSGTLTVIAQSEIDRRNVVRSEITYKYVPGDGAPVPMVDYIPGDWVMTDVTGTMQKVRVRQVLLAWDSDGKVEYTVVLNDQFLENEVRIARRVQGITGGSNLAGGTAAVVKPGPDKLAPAKVTGVSATSLAYINEVGQARAQATVSWSAVTTNADTTAADDISFYEVFDASPAAVAVPGSLVTRTSGTETVVTLSPLSPGSVHRYSVRAVDSAGNRGAFSTAVSLTMSDDTTPPPTPSAPTIVSRLGTAQVFWDGLTDTGAAMPNDFKWLEVHRSTTSNFAGTTTSTIVAIMNQKGYEVFTDQAYGTAYYYRFRAVDLTGNKSTALSVQTASTVTPLVDTDIIGKILSGAKFMDLSVPTSALADGSINAAKLGDGAVTAQKLLDGAVATLKLADDAVTAAKIAALAVGSTEIAANAVVAGKIAAGAVVAGTIVANAVGANEIAADAINAGHIQANAVGATEIAANAVVAGKIAANAVTAGTVAALAIQAGNIAANAVTADAIAAGSITAVKIAAAVITGDKVSVGTLDPIRLSQGVGNLIPNPGFEDPDIRAVRSLPFGYYYETAASDANIYSGNVMLTVNLNEAGGYSGAFFPDIPVKPGDKFYMRQVVRGNGAGSAASFNCEARSQDMATVYNYDLRPFTPTGGTYGWTVQEGLIEVPAGVFWLRPQIKHLASTTTSGQMKFDNLEMRRIFTSNTGGGTVQISPAGLEQFDGAGNRKVLIDSSGAAFFQGSISTGTSGQARVYMSDNATDRSYLYLYSGQASESDATLVAGATSKFVSGSYAELRVIGPRYGTVTSNANVPSLYLTSSTTNTSIALLNATSIRLLANGTAHNFGVDTADIYKIRSKGSGGGALTPMLAPIDGTTFNCGVQFDASGQINIRNNSGTAFVPVAASAFSVGSSVKYKTDLSPLPFSAIEVIRNAPAQMWKYNADFADSANWHFGPMAENLPPEMVIVKADGTMTVDIQSEIGVLWALVGELLTLLKIPVQKAPVPTTSK